MNISGATNATLTLSNVQSDVAGSYQVVISSSSGSVTSDVATLTVPRPAYGPGLISGWGSNTNGELSWQTDTTNVLSLAAGTAHGIVAQDNGLVVNWGSYWTGFNYISVTAPPVLTNAFAVAAGSRHDLALKADGTVVAWGLNDFGQTNVPANATNAIAISEGGQQSVALLKNGTVVQWGQTNAPIPAGLTNVTAIAAVTNFSLALLQNSTVVAWGANNYGQTTIPSNLSNVVAIAAGGSHALALKIDGTVTAWGAWTSVPLNLSNVMNVAAGENQSIALKNDGTVICWGDNTFGETNVISGLSQVKLIAGGGDFSLAVEFSQTVSYPVNVPNDLLLVYNTNSADSATVLNYYLAHRPGVSGANVLGIGFAGFFITNYPGSIDAIAVTNITDYETASPSDFTNQILNPALDWLAANPTKRPQFVILMLDVPTRVYYTATNSANFPFYTYSSLIPSVSVLLRTSVTGWQPFITSINMGGTNECIGYINKLLYFGTNNYSPIYLSISASANGYGNTNWYFDDTVYTGHGYGPFGIYGAQVLIQDGVYSNSVIYTNVIPDNTNYSSHIVGGTNVAGYFCWGSHSSLGVQFPLGNLMPWSGNSGWWIIETVESFNGERYRANQSDYVTWSYSNSFGGANYSNTPVGMVSYTDEPELAGVSDPTIYFPYWRNGKCFAICAWASNWSNNRTIHFQTVGDPFVAK